MKKISFIGFDLIDFNSNSYSKFVINRIKNKDKKVQIVTLNLDFLRIADSNPEFKKLLMSNKVIIPDGKIIVWLVKLLNNYRMQRFTGNDLLQQTLKIASKNQFSISFVGSDSNTLLKIKKQIDKYFPKVKVKQMLEPSYNFEKNPKENQEIINVISSNPPDILFIALGCPRQEFWLDANMERIGVTISAGVGAAFDYFAGKKKRSPKLIQNMGFEWFWRLCREPRRMFKRYILLDIPYLIKLLLRITLKKS